MIFYVQGLQIRLETVQCKFGLASTPTRTYNFLPLSPMYRGNLWHQMTLAKQIFINQPVATTLRLFCSQQRPASRKLCYQMTLSKRAFLLLAQLALKQPLAVATLLEALQRQRYKRGTNYTRRKEAVAASALRTGSTYTLVPISVFILGICLLVCNKFTMFDTEQFI